MTLRVLVACEESGVVRDAFLALGFDAWSCDLAPTSNPGPHLQRDARDVLGEGWDLMIAHPPCTYLSKSGVRWLYSQPERWKLLIEGAAFFREILSAPIPHVAVENPSIHRYARQIIGVGSSQIVHPWQFGHPEQKETHLWLRGLPPLVPTDNVREHMLTLPTKERSRMHYMPPGPERARLRSTTYIGLGAAMAAQWGEALTSAAQTAHLLSELI